MSELSCEVRRDSEGNRVLAWRPACDVGSIELVYNVKWDGPILNASDEWGEVEGEASPKLSREGIVQLIAGLCDVVAAMSDERA